MRHAQRSTLPRRLVGQGCAFNAVILTGIAMSIAINERRQAMKTTKKYSNTEKVFDPLLSRSRSEFIEEEGNICQICGEKVVGFRDELCEKEYRNFGLCQRCQDEKFWGR
jgi:uncharacterized protein with PIN domain